MKFVKRLIILTGSTSKGTLTLEKNAFGIWIKLNTFNLSPSQNRELAVFSGGDVHIVRMDGEGRVACDLPLKDPETIHAAVILGGKVEMYGTNSPVRMSKTQVEEGYSRKKFGGKNSTADETLVLNKSSMVTQTQIYSDRRVENYFLDIVPTYKDDAIAEENYYEKEQEFLYKTKDESQALNGFYTSIPLQASDENQEFFYKQEAQKDKIESADELLDNAEEAKDLSTEETKDFSIVSIEEPEFKIEEDKESLHIDDNARNSEEKDIFQDEAKEITNDNLLDTQKIIVSSEAMTQNNSTVKEDIQNSDEENLSEEAVEEKNAEDCIKFDSFIDEKDENIGEKTINQQRSKQRNVGRIFAKSDFENEEEKDLERENGIKKLKPEGIKKDTGLEKEEVAATVKVLNLNAIKKQAEASEFYARKASFYEKNKDTLDNLFSRYKRYETLEKLLPGSKWVKIDYDGGGRYYVVGVTEDYLCYGVPATYSATPPKELRGYCQWLPKNSLDPRGEGFWVMFQDLASGETVRCD